ncbi:hypothetical protein P7K49_035622 [Saguinus oedipus]|uniref:Uncharacterized protein n=1 Tax=Saguinus oedipus TaxID=9490 RepID=A0ABQ9TPR3_SAGOE|nr:hypothetical protein P7K49_035622 [Saguinus oedipus]
MGLPEHGSLEDGFGGSVLGPTERHSVERVECISDLQEGGNHNSTSNCQGQATASPREAIPCDRQQETQKSLETAAGGGCSTCSSGYFHSGPAILMRGTVRS